MALRMGEDGNVVVASSIRPNHSPRLKSTNQSRLKPFLKYLEGNEVEEEEHSGKPALSFSPPSPPTRPSLDAKLQHKVDLTNNNDESSPPSPLPPPSLSRTPSIPLSNPPSPPQTVVSPTKNPFRKPTKFSLLPASANNHAAHSKTFILLETLNASQTLLLILIPYFSLLLCAFLDSSQAFKENIHFPPPLKPGLSWMNDAFTVRNKISFLPQLSSSLTVDVNYINLTTPVLEKVSKKKIFYVSRLVQDESVIFETPKPLPLPIVCSVNTEGSNNCHSPRLLDVLFSSLGSKVLLSDEATFEISYKPQDADVTTFQATKTIVVSASYDVQKETMSYAFLLSTIRSLLLVSTIIFTLLYVKRMGAETTSEDWWMSPYTLVPERRFILILLFSLALILNPFVIAMQLSPQLAGSKYFHALADLVCGVGIFLMGITWLCLVQGLRYHTTKGVRLRSKQQRDIRVAQQAFLHVKNSTDSSRGELMGALNYLPKSGLVLRHDPSSTFFENFAGPKLTLLFASTMSLLVVVSLRYSVLDLSWLNESFSKTLYLASSFFQTLILALLTYFISKAAVKSGRILRQQSFLDTRYAQLSFNILANVLMLGIVVMVIPVFVDLRALIIKWMGKKTTPTFHEASASDDENHGLSTLVFGEKARSTMENLVRAVTAESSHVPFIATATSFGPGKLLYLAMCCYVVAIVFFPPPRKRDGGDKRTVITLTRLTHAWRIFPLPIKIGSARKASYTPIFCNEIACTLLECSWQSYYSSKEYITDGFAPGKMHLENLGLRLIEDVVDKESDTHCYVCANIDDHPLFEGDETESIVILFRGTVTKENLRTDLRTEQIRLAINEFDKNAKRAEGNNYGSFAEVEEGATLPVSNFVKVKKSSFAGDDLVRVHQGFWECYKRVRSRLIRVVVEEVAKVMGTGGERNPPKIFATGHSLGGALAQLCAYDIASNVSVNISVLKAEKSAAIDGLGKRALKRGRRKSLGGESERVACQLACAAYTFGSPRVGNRSWVQAFNIRVPHHFRVVCERDLFVGLPKWSGFSLYRHAGIECILDENETGNIAVAPTFAEKAFRFSRGYTSLKNHSLMKYRKCLEATFETDELSEYYTGKSNGKGNVVPSWVLVGR